MAAADQLAMRRGWAGAQNGATPIRGSIFRLEFVSAAVDMDQADGSSFGEFPL